MINISTDVGKRQSRWPQADDQESRPPTAARSADRAGSRSLRVRIRAAHAIVGDWVASVARRLGYRLFAMNDDEACWRGWQIIPLYGGLGRRYRDHRW